MRAMTTLASLYVSRTLAVYLERAAYQRTGARKRRKTRRTKGCLRGRQFYYLKRS